MDKFIDRLSTSAGDFWKAILYSVDHMSFTQWCILGSVSVAVGYMLLKTQRF